VIQSAAALTVATGIDGFAKAAVGSSVSLVLDRSDSLAQTPEVLWAAKEFENACAARGMKVLRCGSLAQANAGDFCILAAGITHPTARSVLDHAKLQLADSPEAVGIVYGTVDGNQVLVATGSDVRGMVYALLELADRTALETDPSATLKSGKSLVERPANRVRSMTRLFTSDVEDKPWFNDREMWPHYFTALIKQRFNRFNLAFGIGYDFIREVTDAYLLFTYPFLLKVPGYNVKATNLPDAERDANLAMLKYIAKEAVARGLEFHVGLWMHGYEWINSPHANHVIEGITNDNHGPYCRDAVRMLLQEIPEISGVTFRIHGESGVTEGSYKFWKEVFEGVATCGRQVSIDMHTKGMDETMENLAIGTGMPVQMSPKYWGEHLGMPYHQSDIRVMEQPKPGAENNSGLMKFSAGTRSFLRYGYGDLLREDRKWAVVHRIWPGSQRILIWGDPVWAAAYSRAFSFCGSDGVEVMEMLSFKGRRGSGIAGNRTAYKDRTLAPRWDWEKYEYTTRVWGRMLYNPESEHEVFTRGLHKNFGPAAENVCAALSQASRILPTVLTAYAPSAGNNTYWPELYTNETYVDAAHVGPYSDSPKPVLFHTASTFDPPLFSRMSEHADELMGGEKSGKYSPIEVAAWLEEYADGASKAWSIAETMVPKKQSPEYRRMAVDLAMQIGLGEFYAARFRSGVLFAIYEKTKDRRALEKSIALYKSSRATWAKLADRAKNVYLPDVTVGEQPYQRGHWMDRLPPMDRDIASVEALLIEAKAGTDAEVTNAIAVALGRPIRRTLRVSHVPAATFRPGAPLAISLTVEDAESVKLYYRHVNQSERYSVVKMEGKGPTSNTEIPAMYTSGEYPLEYFFEVKQRSGKVFLYPGFAESRATQPYFVVRRG
jgi:hypothetical protein